MSQQDKRHLKRVRNDVALVRKYHQNLLPNTTSDREIDTECDLADLELEIIEATNQIRRRSRHYE